MTDIEIPKRMRKLKRDKRGYPIPVTVLVDGAGEPLHRARPPGAGRVLRADQCSLCGKKLEEAGRALVRPAVRGPAFGIVGAYYDPPMRGYVMPLAVCPYLCRTNLRRIDEKNNQGGFRKPGLVIRLPRRPSSMDCPLVFVAVATTGQQVTDDNLIIPRDPVHQDRILDARHAVVARPKAKHCARREMEMTKLHQSVSTAGRSTDSATRRMRFSSGTRVRRVRSTPATRSWCVSA